MIRILLVEDDTEDAEALIDSVTSGCEARFTVARSRDAALAALDEAQFDLVICDLRIPSIEGALDESPEFGQAVHDHILTQSPGTPAVILTAYEPSRTELAKTLTSRPFGDPFGVGTSSAMTIYFEKDQLPEVIQYIIALAESVAALEAIEVAQGTTGLELTDAERRTLQIYARRRNGSVIKLEPLSGGLSGAKTVRIEVRAPDLTLCARAVAKIDDLRSIREEVKRVKEHASSLLAAGTFPAVADTVETGAGAMGAIVLAAADPSVTSLFNFLSAHPGDGGQLLTAVRTALEPWRQQRTGGQMTVREVRSMVATDEDVARAQEGLDFDLGRTEGLTIQVAKCRDHGDLHGGNILVAESGQLLIIDYARSTMGTASLDPVSLELSFVFHPDAQAYRDGWPTQDQAAEWGDLDVYTAGCAFPDFIRACRKWAHEESGGDREVIANAYALAIRQLRYGNHVIALAIAGYALARLDGSG
jgi:CheY-like chemotaxis protein